MIKEDEVKKHKNISDSSIKIHRIKCGNGNCYVIEQNDNAILVDTGKIEFQHEIEENIKNFPVKLIVLTHGHFDHCENAQYFSELFNAPIAMNRQDINLIDNQLNQELFAKTILGKVVLKTSITSFKKVKIDFKPSVFLEDNDTLEMYGINAKIISLPGHTKGSIGIDCGQAGVIVGDALMNMFYPTISMLYGNRNEVLQSAQRITRLGNVPIFFGHGKCISNKIW